MRRLSPSYGSKKMTRADDKTRALLFVHQCTDKVFSEITIDHLAQTYSRVKRDELASMLAGAREARGVVG